MLAGNKLKDRRIMVAMSGGVDSSVAAYLLKKENIDIAGVTMCFGLTFEDGNPKQCCDPKSISDAKRVCNMIDIPHYVLDHAEELKKFVIDDFVEEYKKGRTPNPCVRCNQRLKFDNLLEKARDMGLDSIATGHYAKIEEDESGFHLEMATDRHKDQTYFLWGIKKEDLPYIVFPVSHIEKPELRKIAENAGLEIAHKQESQDICFVTDGNYRNLLANYGVESKSGDMVTVDGTVVGEHSGIVGYTVGQRKGLGVALGRPQYVVDIDTKNNRVVIGDRKDLDANGLYIDEYNELESLPSTGITIKIRSTMAPVKCSVEKAGERLKVLFDEPQFAISPGQSAVLYDGIRVIGGGITDERIS